MINDVKSVRAHVHNGQVVFDEPLELPEGTTVEVIIPDDVTSTDAELEKALAESDAEFARGEYVDARSFARSLVSKP